MNKNHQNVQNDIEVIFIKKKYKVKRFVLPLIYVIVVLIFVLTSFIAFMSNGNEIDQKDNIKYVSDELVTDDVPVVSVANTITVPYNKDTVQISNYFYDYSGTAQEQEKSIHSYENTYIQNSGVDYISNEPFDILSAYEGKVIKVEENDIVGKIVEIKHDNNIVTVYQGLSEVSVKENDNVVQSQIIGKSGKSKIVSSSDNHLHFEIYVNGKVINPLNCFGKRIDELN